MSSVGRRTRSKESAGPPNDYEELRNKHIASNNEKLRALNVKRISASLSSMVVPLKKKRQGKRKTFEDEDEDYEPQLDDGDDDDNDDDKGKHKLMEDQPQKKLSLNTKAKGIATEYGAKRDQFIQPLSPTKFLRLSKEQQREMVGDDAADAFSSVMKVLQEAAIRKQQFEQEQSHDKSNYDSESYQEKFKDADMPLYSEEFDIEQGNKKLSANEQMGERISLETTSSDEVDDQVVGDEELIIADSSGKKRTRGHGYSRKLTSLPPGEKLYLEFNDDGVPVGENSSIYACFLGEQVRNRGVCPVQVKDFDDYKPHTLDHLWSCVLEKFEFDNPDLRKAWVIRHARSLFRNSRHKLKRKYIIDPKLTTKEEQLKNKPTDMLKADWKYLVEHWRMPKEQEKSIRAKESRAKQKLPHYTGRKGYDRVRDELEKKHGTSCSRIDVLVETRKRKSTKPVNEITLAHNKHVVDEITKLKKQREDGLNQMGDEEIFTKVLGRDTHGYLRAYGRGKTITQFHGVKPSRVDLSQVVMNVKKEATYAVQEAQKDADKARKEAEEARKEAAEARKNADEARKNAEKAKIDAEAFKNEVDLKIEANNKLWDEKLMDLIQSGYKLAMP